jgi:hypothetical protein
VQVRASTFGKSVNPLEAIRGAFEAGGIRPG